MLWPKTTSYNEFDDEKKIPAARKFPSPPHNFSNGPSLSSIIMLLKLDNLTRNVRLSEVLRTWIEFFYSCFLVGTSLSKTRYKWVSFFSRTLWIGLFCRGSKSPLSFFVVSSTCNVLKSPLSLWSVSKSIIQYDQQVWCRFRPPFPRCRRVVGLILIKIVVSKPVACLVT